MPPNQFNTVTELPLGLGMEKCEYEEFAVHMLNRHIEANQPFDIPFEYKYDHSEMVPEWLNDLGDRKYTLTKKSLGLLYGMFGK